MSTSDSDVASSIAQDFERLESPLGVESIDGTSHGSPHSHFSAGVRSGLQSSVSRSEIGLGELVDIRDSTLRAGDCRRAPVQPSVEQKPDIPAVVFNSNHYTTLSASTQAAPSPHARSLQITDISSVRGRNRTIEQMQLEDPVGSDNNGRRQARSGTKNILSSLCCLNWLGKCFGSRSGQSSSEDEEIANQNLYRAMR